MILFVLLLSLLCLVGIVAAIRAVLTDDPGPRPYRSGYDSRHPQ